MAPIPSAGAWGFMAAQSWVAGVSRLGSQIARKPASAACQKHTVMAGRFHACTVAVNYQSEWLAPAQNPL